MVQRFGLRHFAVKTFLKFLLLREKDKDFAI
jgi:hypothetical protein